MKERTEAALIAVSIFFLLIFFFFLPKDKCPCKKADFNRFFYPKYFSKRITYSESALNSE
jgi:hypothetical protein